MMRGIWLDWQSFSRCLSQHQGGALALFTAALWTAYELRPAVPSGLQRPVKIRYQVRGILDAHGDPDQTVGDSEPVALGRG